MTAALRGGDEHGAERIGDAEFVRRGHRHGVGSRRRAAKDLLAGKPVVEDNAELGVAVLVEDMGGEISRPQMPSTTVRAR